MQLRRIFEHRTNFDLRRLLNGTSPSLFLPFTFLYAFAGAEPFMTSLLDRLEGDLQ